MLDDYLEKFYKKLAERSALLRADKFKKAIEIAAWKEKVVGFWDNITVHSTEIPENFGKDMCVGQEYQFKVTLANVGSDHDLGIELVICNIRPDGKRTIKITEFDLLKVENGLQTFGMNYKLDRAGHFTYAVRVFPKNADLPHRQDFCYVKWIN